MASKLCPLPLLLRMCFLPLLEDTMGGILERRRPGGSVCKESLSLRGVLPWGNGLPGEKSLAG